MARASAPGHRMLAVCYARRPLAAAMSAPVLEQVGETQVAESMCAFRGLLERRFNECVLTFWLKSWRLRRSSVCSGGRRRPGPSCSRSPTGSRRGSSRSTGRWAPDPRPRMWRRGRRALIYSLVHGFGHSPIYSLIHSLIHLLIHSSIHPFIHPFIHPLIHPDASLSLVRGGRGEGKTQALRIVAARPVGAMRAQSHMPLVGVVDRRGGSALL